MRRTISAVLAVVVALLIGGTVLVLSPGPGAFSTAQAQTESNEEVNGLNAKIESSEATEMDEDPDGNPYVAGELIVTYEEDLTQAAEAEVVQMSDGNTLDKLPEIDARHLAFPEIKAETSREARERALEQEKEALEQDPSVEAVDYNYIRKAQAVPNDTFYSAQWGLPRINAPQAWDITTGSGAVIAVLDTGIDQTHPDLASKVVAQIDTVNNDNVANDDDGHGTHVAGIASAITNNGQGVAGASPGAKLQIAKVLGPTGGSDATVAAGIDWAIRNPAADVINMSLGGCGASTALENAVNRAWNAGTVVVAAAGNEAERGNCTSYPAAYTNSIAVGSVNTNNTRSNFSNIGTYVDIAAPGGQSSNGCSSDDDIASTYPTGRYVYLCGTSMASPFVSGVAALLASQNLTASQIRSKMESTATDLGTAGKDSNYGHGLVNAQAAANSGGGDTTNPNVTMSAPANGAIVRGASVTLSAAATDNVGVSKVEFLVDGIVRGTDDTPGDGFSLAWNSAGVAEGRHNVSARAFDAANNRAISAARSITVDNLDPNTAITSGPSRVKTSGSRARAAFRFVGSSGTISFQCSLDGKPFAACASPKSYKVKPGRHTFKVRAIGSAGVAQDADRTPAVKNFKVIKKRR